MAKAAKQQPRHSLILATNATVKSKTQRGIGGGVGQSSSSFQVNNSNNKAKKKKRETMGGEQIRTTNLRENEELTIQMAIDNEKNQVIEIDAKAMIFELEEIPQP